MKTREFRAAISDRTIGSTLDEEAIAHDWQQNEAAHSNTLTELRATLERLTHDVALVAERRAAAAAKCVADGADGLRSGIRQAPVTSLAVAVVAGALLAVVLTTGRSAEPAWRQSARRYGSAMRDEMDAMMVGARRAADDARASTAGIMPSVERLAQTLAQMDVSSTLAPAVEKGSAILRSMWAAATGR